MLSQSPNLRSLSVTIQSNPPLRFDATPILRCRFPDLTTLHLDRPIFQESIGSFLEAHPKLESLSLPNAFFTVQAAEPLYPIGVLPCLTKVIGDVIVVARLLMAMPSGLSRPLEYVEVQDVLGQKTGIHDYGAWMTVLGFELGRVAKLPRVRIGLDISLLHYLPNCWTPPNTTQLDLSVAGWSECGGRRAIKPPQVFENLVSDLVGIACMVLFTGVDSELVAIRWHLPSRYRDINYRCWGRCGLEPHVFRRGPRMHVWWISAAPG